MEAMLAGVPVVATSIPGSIDLVTPGVNGWLASPNKPDHLAEVIVDALLDSEHRESYRRAAAVSVKEFSLERIAEKYQALYIEIMS
jgi:glycosyltransferase involved in cell wall biosynthesis